MSIQQKWAKFKCSVMQIFASPVDLTEDRYVVRHWYLEVFQESLMQ